MPELGSERFIKRVVGIGGDTIMLRSGQLYVNGKAEIYQKDVSNEHSATWESPHSDHSYQIATQGTEHLDYGPVDVPIDYFFVLSDNRSVSHDSRSWGPIPYSCLKGRVALLWSPKKRTGSWVK
ncbi:MAG: signal peptidase I [Deltaproteobacteria bacterium]|nr:signal peptidase I [Deltaproteobacteria bacterium]